jgi:hypothetical protein
MITGPQRHAGQAEVSDHVAPCGIHGRGFPVFALRGPGEATVRPSAVIADPAAGP